MKVLIIYSNDSSEYVSRLRREIRNEYGRETVLRLHDTDRSDTREQKSARKSLFRHAWHKDAKKMMMIADIIVCVIGEKTAENENVNWEIDTALKYKRNLVILKQTPDAKVPDRLIYYDEKTKEEGYIVDEIKSEGDLFSLIKEFNIKGYLRLFNDVSDKEILFEQYKLFSDTAEALVDRRQKVNSFYISANTALCTIGATIFALGDTGITLSKLFVVLALTVPGILLNVSWLGILKAYAINNKGKMTVLGMIEKQLPASLYDAEWKAMKNKYNKEKYVSSSERERMLPAVFIVFYVLLAVFSGLFLILKFRIFG